MQPNSSDFDLESQHFFAFWSPPSACGCSPSCVSPGASRQVLGAHSYDAALTGAMAPTGPTNVFRRMRARLAGNGSGGGSRRLIEHGCDRSRSMGKRLVVLRHFQHYRPRIGATEPIRDMSGTRGLLLPVVSTLQMHRPTSPSWRHTFLERDNVRRFR